MRRNSAWQALLAVGLLQLRPLKPRTVGFLGVIASAVNCYMCANGLLQDDICHICHPASKLWCLHVNAIPSVPTCQCNTYRSLLCVIVPHGVIEC